MNKEEEKEIESEEEEKSEEEQEEKESEGSEEEKQSEEENSEEGYIKEGEEVDHNKYNQALRKAREAELRERELLKQLEEKKSAKPEKVEPKKEEKSETKKEEKKKEDDFWEEDDEEEEEKEGEEEKSEAPDVLAEAAKLVDEKMKPFYEEQERKKQKEKEDQRTVFFEQNPQYLSDSKKFAQLLDKMDTAINPNAGSYYEQLEMAHLLLTGKKANPVVEQKKAEIAEEAGSGGSVKSDSLEDNGITAADRKIMKEMGVSEEGMKAFKKKVADGSMTLIGGETIIK